MEEATFAGGCFWCMEQPFEALGGVKDVIAGYMGGHQPDPSYQDICTGQSGHLEVVRVLYDPGRVGYQALLDVFWRQIDPTDSGGSFVDRGDHYRSAIFYHTKVQKEMAEASRDRLDASGRFSGPVVTVVAEASTFYPAEEYHQDYHKKNSVQYLAYRTFSGRDPFIRSAWKDLETNDTAADKGQV